MKNLMALIFLTINLYAGHSHHAQAQIVSSSQGYMQLSSGQVASIKSFLSTDLPTIFMLPGLYMTKERFDHKGGNFFINNDGVLFTVDAAGFIYRKPDYDTKGRIKEVGGNYFITRRGQLHIVTHLGHVLKYNDGIDGINMRRISVAGGNYFIDNDNKIVVIDGRGIFGVRTNMFRMKAEDVKVKGHNYFIMKDGTLFTVGTVLSYSANGVQNSYPVLYKQNEKFPRILKHGGNYFFDSQKNIHTIGEDGVLNGNIINRRIKVLDTNSVARIDLPVKTGVNYFSYADGTAMFVDINGIYHELPALESAINITNF